MVASLRHGVLLNVIVNVTIIWSLWEGLPSPDYKDAPTSEMSTYSGP